MRATRRDLLRIVRGAPLLRLALPAVAVATPTRAAREVVLLADTTVAGTAYYDAALAAPHLSPGDTLELRREPTNRHDARAIEVHARVRPTERPADLLVDLLDRGGPLKLGYVPRAENEALAALMDAGVPVTATVLSADSGSVGYSPSTRGTWSRVRFAVRGSIG